MYRIDNATALPTIPTPAAVGPVPNGFFTKGNPNTAELATIVDDDWLNALQEELANVIESAGITLSKTDRTQLLAAIQTLVNGTPYAVSSTVANTYTATLTPVPLSYTTGMLVLIKFTHGNTGAATINLNTLGAKNIKRLDGSALSSGDIYDSMVAIMCYDGTNFQLLNAQVIKASSIQNNSFSYAADVGSANTLSATLTPAPAYTAGMTVFIKVAANNTGASTVNLNGLGAKNIKRCDLTDVLAGNLAAGMIAELCYDGTQFQLINPVQLSQKTTTEITSSGTFTVPAGVYSLYVEAWGGGGAGGGSQSGGVQGGGGGSGAYAAGYVPTTPGATFTVTIGAGGTAATINSNNPGGDGGDTSFGSSIIAKAGTGGLGATTFGSQAGAGGLASACTGQIKLNGQDGYNTSASQSLTSGIGGSSPRNTQVRQGSSGHNTSGFSFDGLANTGQGGMGGASSSPSGAGGSGLITVTY
jgi:hypothetical protein